MLYLPSKTQTRNLQQERYGQNHSGQNPFDLSGVKFPDKNIDSPIYASEPIDTSIRTPDVNTVNYQFWSFPQRIWLLQ